MDEDILLLKKTASSLRIHQASMTYDRRQAPPPTKKESFIFYFYHCYKQKYVSQGFPLFLLEKFSDLSMTLLGLCFTPTAVSVSNICHCLCSKVTIHIFAFFWYTAYLILL